MTIRIELTPEEETALRAQAAREGREVEELAGEAVRTLVQDYIGTSVPRLPRVVDASGVFHPEHWEAVMHSIHRGSAQAPALPTDSLTRAALYSDHD
jgi:hypothetical protein